jgi:hypothetical protein
MSVFQVQLNSTAQGRLDLDPSTHPLAGGTVTSPATYGQLGTQFATSKQRQIWVAGPNRRYRLLRDGETFTDCNYWKQFAYPNCPLERAFISVVSDDGSVYSDVPEENVFTKGDTETLSTSLADTVIDFVTTYGGPARFLSVQNLAGSDIDITGELNGDTNITFVVGQGETMMFNQGDMVITMLRLKAASSTPNASWIASIKSTCNS